MTPACQGISNAAIEQKKSSELAQLIQNFIRGVLKHHPTVLAISVQIIPDTNQDVETWVDNQPCACRRKALELFSDARRAEMDKLSLLNGHKVTQEERVEELIAWRWLWDELKAQYGIRRPGTGVRLSAVDANTLTQICMRVSDAPPRSRKATIRAISIDLNLNFHTVYRAWLKWKHRHERVKYRPRRPGTRGRPTVLDSRTERHIVTRVREAPHGFREATIRAVAADLNISVRAVDRVWQKWKYNIHEQAESRVRRAAPGDRDPGANASAD